LLSYISQALVLWKEEETIAVSELNTKEYFQVKFIENYYSQVQISNSVYSRIQTMQHTRKLAQQLAKAPSLTNRTQQSEISSFKSGIFQNYWVFGLCPSAGILKIRKRNVSETGSLSVLR
jgi:hypothetical protein